MDRVPVIGIDLAVTAASELAVATGATIEASRKVASTPKGLTEGIAKAAKRVGRETSNGVVEAYLHRTSEDYPPQVGALVEVDCESDFVAKGDDFRRLARELAMHVAAAAPR